MTKKLICGYPVRNVFMNNAVYKNPRPAVKAKPGNCFFEGNAAGKSGLPASERHFSVSYFFSYSFLTLSVRNG